MLSTESVQALLNPISDDLPSGSDLEYDAAFMALEAEARPKAEQQFGDTVIPAVEPDWRNLVGSITGLLQRTKDVRVTVLALRAATRTQGIEGFALGLDLTVGLLGQFWDTIHPQLDAQDDNDPTMRINALAPLTDSAMVLRDVYDCLLGTSRNVGPVRVRDIAIAHNKLTAGSGDAGYSAGQIEGALQDIYAAEPAALTAACSAAEAVQKLEAIIQEKTGRGDHIDLKPLRSITHLLRQACQAAMGTPTTEADDQDAAEGGAPNTGSGVRGEINSRQDALLVLDKVISYLERTEPGNPAPLLIKRAKRLVGVSFLDIMADLAPDALGSIQIVTGRPTED